MLLLPRLWWHDKLLDNLQPYLYSDEGISSRCSLLLESRWLVQIDADVEGELPLELWQRNNSSCHRTCRYRVGVSRTVFC